MVKKLCYGEVCKTDDGISVRILVLLVLIIAVVIVAAWVIRSVVTGSELFNFPLFPSE